MTATVRGVSVDGRGVSINNEATHEYTVTYKVVTDDRNDGPSVVEQASGIPKLGDMYACGNDFDPGAACISKSARQTESPWEWEVDVTYSNAPITITGVPGNEPVANPLDEPAEVTYAFQQRTVKAYGYYDDPSAPPSDLVWHNTFCASNGEPFDPQPEIEISEPVLTIKRNVQTINSHSMMSLANCVNSDVWQNAMPRQLKLNAPQPTRKYSSVCGFYWEVTYSIAFRYETWDIHCMNQGSYYWSGGKPDPVTAADMKDPTKLKRVYRDGAISIVNLTADGDFNATNTMTWQSFRVYREVNFGSLGLL